MDIFSVLTMIGGLSLFLYGMNTMGDGLARLAGGKLERILEKLTSKRIFAVLLGAAVTAVIQSSSATTVMVVGFVNSGIMHLQQAVGIIMGANIGTTITSWLLSLTGIEGDSIFMQLLKPSSFSPVLAAIGILLTMTSKHNNRKKEIGTIFLGFAVLMFGMETMSSAVTPLADNPKFTGILTAFSNPILGLIAGTVLTAVIQSSSASVGILQALCNTGAVPFSTALPIIMGQNIGTCVTALLSSIGANKNAKRASMIHLYFNLIGTVIFMVVFYSLNSVVHFAFMNSSANAAGIAVLHSLFNVGCAALLFPFANLLVKLATFTIKDKDSDETAETDASMDETIVTALDERFLDQPAFAMELCRNAAKDMILEVKEALLLSLELFPSYDQEKADKVLLLEKRVDSYDDLLGSYLVKLSSKSLTKDDSQSLSLLLHTLNDFERVSDHAVNLVEEIQLMHENNMNFSDRAKEEMQVLIRAIRDITEKTIQVFIDHDLEGATHIEPLEEIVDGLTKSIKQRHIRRLKKGTCTIMLGIPLENMLTDLERISDHYSNIAVSLIEIAKDNYETHEYIDRLSMDENEAFRKECVFLKSIYALPEKNETANA